MPVSWIKFCAGFCLFLVGWEVQRYRIRRCTNARNVKAVSFSLRTAATNFFFLFLGGCRRVKFIPPENGYYLNGHVFLNLTIGIYTPCEHRCVMESKCVSVNIGPPANYKVVCELSDSDHLQHPGDLKPRHGWTYIGTEV